jgi:hypothetical protein
MNIFGATNVRIKLRSPNPMHKNISTFQQMMKVTIALEKRAIGKEEMNLENNDDQFFYSMKGKLFQNIVSESRILDAVSNEENDENILIFETPHPIKHKNILEKPRLDYIETWFESDVGQEIPSCSQHIWFSNSSTHFGHAPDFVVLSSICFRVLELIPNIKWMLEWIHTDANPSIGSCHTTPTPN